MTTTKQTTKNSSNITNLVEDSTDLRDKIELPTILFKRLTPQTSTAMVTPSFITPNCHTQVVLSASPPVPLPVVVLFFPAGLIEDWLR
jgi:hypothetical protein